MNPNPNDGSSRVVSGIKLKGKDNRMRTRAAKRLRNAPRDRSAHIEMIWLGKITPEEIRAASNITWEEIVKMGEDFIREDDAIRAAESAASAAEN